MDSSTFFNLATLFNVSYDVIGKRANSPSIVLASNVDLACIVVAPEPMINPILIDRYLVFSSLAHPIPSQAPEHECFFYKDS